MSGNKGSYIIFLFIGRMLVNSADLRLGSELISLCDLPFPRKAWGLKGPCPDVLMLSVLLGDFSAFWFTHHPGKCYSQNREKRGKVTSELG